MTTPCLVVIVIAVVINNGGSSGYFILDISVAFLLFLRAPSLPFFGFELPTQAKACAGVAHSVRVNNLWFSEL